MIKDNNQNTRITGLSIETLTLNGTFGTKLIKKPKLIKQKNLSCEDEQFRLSIDQRNARTKSYTK